MLKTFASSHALSRGCWELVRNDFRLLLFPILSGTASVLLFGSFVMPFACNLDWFFQVTPDNHVQIVVPNVAAEAAAFFAYYFVTAFVITYFNAALASCALARFRGESPSPERGLRDAAARLPQLAAWALLSASVGSLLRLFERNKPAGGSRARGLFGASWLALTYFVVPLLVAERLGPVGALKRSAQLLKRSWLQALLGKATFGGLAFLVIFLGLALLFGGMAYGFISRQWELGGGLLALLVLFMLCVAVLVSAVQSVYRCALYHILSEGEVPFGLDPELFTELMGDGATGGMKS